MLYVDVILPLPLANRYTYSLPEVLEGQVAEGSRVIVPFGRKKFYTALVARIHSDPPTGYEIKDVVEVLDPHPILLPGDLVVVRRQQTANSGEIVVALIEDEATVKRLSLRNGQIWLMPENDAYAPIDGSNAQILGKVAAVVRRY